MQKSVILTIDSGLIMGVIIDQLCLWVKKQRNIWKKHNENLQKRRFPPYFQNFRTEKIFFLKFWLGHILTIVNKHLWALKSEKTNDKISRKCQKTGFSGIFPAFSTGKIFFSKIGLLHILNLIILRQCAKFHVQYSSRYSRNTVFLDSSGDF